MKSLRLLTSQEIFKLCTSNFCCLLFGLGAYELTVKSALRMVVVVTMVVMVVVLLVMNSALAPVMRLDYLIVTAPMTAPREERGLPVYSGCLVYVLQFLGLY